jgi:hypothetical protein
VPLSTGVSDPLFPPPLGPELETLGVFIGLGVFVGLVVGVGLIGWLEALLLASIVG